MYRVLARNGLCLPANYTATVRQAAGVRREAFACPPGRRNRLWQADFSEYETTAGGRWNLGGVVDYWTKVNLACAVIVRKTTSDAISVFEAALAEVEAILGATWVEDLTDPATGEIATLRLLTDNGSWPRRPASGPGSPPSITSRTSAPAAERRGPTASSSASSQPSKTSTSTGATSATARNSPTRSPPTARSTTRSDPTKPSPCADPSSATDTVLGGLVRRSPLTRERLTGPADTRTRLECATSGRGGSPQLSCC